MTRYRLLIPLLIILLGVIWYSNSQLPFSSSAYLPGPQLTAADRVMIVAVHPDDETIATGGLINYCTLHQIPVRVVVLTDGGYKGTADLRHNETLNATSVLGLHPSDVTFLGFPDGSLYYLFNHNWDLENPYLNGQGSSRVNCSYAFRENQTICGVHLVQDLEEIINQFQPSVIIYPDGNDQQEDHKSAQAFLEYTTLHLNYTGKTCNYLVHFAYSWPYPRTYNPEYSLLPPEQFEDANWNVFTINTIMERNKEAALKSYHSQVGLSSYLLSFIRKNELFSSYDTFNVKLDGNTSQILCFTDPAGQEYNHNPPPNLDLKEVGVQVQNNKLWLYLQTAAPPSASGYYCFRIVGLGSSVSRWDIQIHQGQAKSLKVNSQSEKLQDLKTEVHGSKLTVEIPLESFEKSDKIILSAYTSKGQGTVDPSRWQVINVKK